MVRPRPEVRTQGTGAIVAFNIKGGVEAGKRFVDGLELHSHVANIGDVRSLVIHPASTTHSQLTVEQQVAAGVNPPGLVRLSVGIEHVDDIIADLEAGFRAAKGANAAAWSLSPAAARVDDYSPGAVRGACS